METVEREKRAVEKGKRREISWENEAKELKRKKDRWESMMLKRDIKKWQDYDNEKFRKNKQEK